MEALHTNLLQNIKTIPLKHLDNMMERLNQEKQTKKKEI